MSAGLTILNDSRTIQIDENYKTLCYKDRQTLQTSNSGFFNPATYRFVGDNPVIAIRPTATSACPMGVQFIDGAWQYSFFAEAAHSSIDIYTFDNPITSPTNYGTQVWDAAGNLTFDSGYKFLKIVAFLPDVSPPAVNSYYVWTGEEGKTYGVIYCAPTYKFNQGSSSGINGFSFIGVTSCQINGKIVSFKSLAMLAPNGTVDTGTTYNAPVPVLIVDLSGY